MLSSVGFSMLEYEIDVIQLIVRLKYSKSSIRQLLSTLEPFVKAEALVYFIQACSSDYAFEKTIES